MTSPEPRLMSGLALERQDRRKWGEAPAGCSPAPARFDGESAAQGGRARPTRAWNALQLVPPWLHTFKCYPATLLWIVVAWPVAAAEISQENQTKAAFLIKLAQFTDWPANAFRTTNSPAVIGIVGTDPFDRFLDKTAKDARAHGRRLEIERYHSLEEIKTCHILYIGKSEKNRLNEVLDMVKSKPVLTVSDMSGSSVHPVMVRFVTERTRVRFRIHVEQTKTAGLTISSKVLREAEIVGPNDK